MAIRILYIEDEQSIQDLVSTHLTLQGFEVRRTSTGEEAVRLLENESFDLLLLDIQMPKGPLRRDACSPCRSDCRVHSCRMLAGLAIS